jgi:hypothetical protein
MGHKLSGFFSVKGSKKMEMIYCDFFPYQNGIDVLLLFKFKIVNLIVLLFSFKRQTEMDRIRRRQIDARPFLRPAGKFSVYTWNNSVRFGGGERGKRHEFEVGDIHGPTTGNLLLLVHGTGGF